MAIDESKVALVLLAAGRAERFGGGKLLAYLNGFPLGLLSARTLARIGFAQKLAVVGATAPNYAALGFDIIQNDAPERGQSHSIRLGIEAVHAPVCLIALADMPFVSEDHIRAMLAAFDGDMLVSSLGKKRLPPALFGNHRYAALRRLKGDQGARNLLADAPHLVADEKCLADIDTAVDLERWR